MNITLFGFAWRGLALAVLYLVLQELADVFLWEEPAELDVREIIAAFVIGFVVNLIFWLEAKKSRK